MATRDSLVQQLLVRGSSWGEHTEGKTEEENDAIWKNFLMQSGANLTSPVLSVLSGVLVPVLLRARAQVQVLWY